MIFKIKNNTQVFKKYRLYIVFSLEPFNLLRLQLAFAVDDAHVDLQAVLVLQQLFHAVIELEEGADQHQPVLGAFDEFFQEVIGGGGVEKLCHSALQDFSDKAV